MIPSLALAIQDSIVLFLLVLSHPLLAQPQNQPAHDRLPHVSLSEAELDRLWKVLADADPAHAFRAVIRLASCPESTPQYLGRRLEPAQAGAPADKVDVLSNPEVLSSVRAVEALEYLGTPEAQHVLRKLAAGATAARLTQEAKESLKRLSKTSDLNRGSGKPDGR